MTDVLFINGLSCGDRTQDIFIRDLQATLGDGFRIHRPDLAQLDRTSTKTAVYGIADQFRHLKDPIVIGFSLGGLWAVFLARHGFTSRVIAISPAVPSNWVQIDPLRLRLFGSSLLFGKPFKFSYEVARDHLMKNVPDAIVREVSAHFIAEPASLIRDYGLMRAFTKLSTDDVRHLQAHVSGLIITGSDDRMTTAQKQKEFAEMVGFRQRIWSCGHTPQLGPHREHILEEIAAFVGTSNVSYPNFSSKKAG
jgi:pimeloyl-ACP methyl ester carboxylesterase